MRRTSAAVSAATETSSTRVVAAVPVRSDRGTTTVNVEPMPGCDSTPIVWPSRSARRCVIASPSPKPSAFRRRVPDLVELRGSVRRVDPPRYRFPCRQRRWRPFRPRAHRVRMSPRTVYRIAFDTRFCGFLRGRSWGRCGCRHCGVDYKVESLCHACRDRLGHVRVRRGSAPGTPETSSSTRRHRAG